MEIKRGYSRKEAAHYLGLKVDYLARHQDGVSGPKCVKLGGNKTLYIKDELDRWLDSLAKQEVNLAQEEEA